MVIKNLMKKLFSLLVIVFTLISCKTNPPTEPAQTEYGTIKLLSNIDGAEIFIDNVSTGKFTPDSLITVTVGSHILELKKVGFITFADTIDVKLNQETKVVATLAPILDFGIINVLSNESDAIIYLDGINTGKLAPDTIRTTVGNHIVELQKNGYSNVVDTVTVLKDAQTDLQINLFPAKVVLIEDFANVSCNPCVISNKILEQLTNHSFGRKKLVAIKFPTNFPSPVDPFFLANGPDCNARMSYYNIQIAPTNVVDGLLRPIPSDSNDVKTKVNTQLEKIPQFVVLVEHGVSGSNYTTNITLEVKDISNLDFSKLVLHTVVTETNIEFSTPPGSNGETKFYDVMRKMLPTNQGESLSSINHSGKYIYQRQLTLNSNWIASNINTVVFIQNTETKEIYQAGSTFN